MAQNRNVDERFTRVSPAIGTSLKNISNMFESGGKHDISFAFSDYSEYSQSTLHMT